MGEGGHCDIEHREGGGGGHCDIEHREGGGGGQCDIELLRKVPLC